MVATGISTGRPLVLRLARPIHKYLGLFAAIFWLVQAITGIAIAIILQGLPAPAGHLLNRFIRFTPGRSVDFSVAAYCWSSVSGSSS